MTETAGARPKVVVVDDEDDVRDVIVESLALAGYEALPATNGLEALLQIKRNRPAAVTLDVRMPRLGGLDALSRIHRFDPAIRVVIVTGDIDEKTAERAFAMGAVAVLRKPVTLDELLAAIRGPVTAPPAPAVVPGSRAEPAPATLRALVVDDEPGVREMLEAFLRSRGYEVGTAGDARAALLAVATRPPHVVLLDVHLPGLAGHEMLAPLRVMAPGTVVIMVSGTADADVARRSLALGAFDYVTKPIDFDYLAQALETALAMSTLEP